MPCGALLKLKKLTLDGAHPGHETIKLRKKISLILLCLFDKFRGGAVADALKGIRELAIQKPHMVLQFQELLVKLGLLEHGRVSRENGRLKG